MFKIPTAVKWNRHLVSEIVLPKPLTEKQRYAKNKSEFERIRDKVMALPKSKEDIVYLNTLPKWRSMIWSIQKSKLTESMIDREVELWFGMAMWKENNIF